MEKHPESLHVRFNKEFVLECAKFILQNNNMKFDNELYNQIKVQQWVQSSLQLVQFCRWDVLKSNFIVSALLNMENCYTVSRSSQISPEELLLTLNSINPSKQLIMKYSKDQVPFLDILIKRNENGILMDLYHKPTDTQRYLTFTSSHQAIVNETSHFV